MRKEAIKNKTNKLSIIEFLKAKPCNTINVSIINSDIFDVFHKKPPNFPLSYYFLGYCLNKIIVVIRVYHNNLIYLLIFIRI